MVVAVELRISAQRAFLGRIHPEMRLVKIKALENHLRLSVVLSNLPSDRINDDISCAAAEIIADFPGARKIEESIEVNAGPLAVEDVLVEGWVYRRAEIDRAD